MVGDVLKKIQTGDAFEPSASAWNALIDAAQALRKQQQGQRFPDRQTVRQADVILVKNISGAAVNRGGVLGISAPLVLPSDNLDEFKTHPVLSCTTPAVASHLGNFVVAMEPIGSGETGLAAISGVVPVKLYVDAVDNTFADVNEGNAANLLAGGCGSARVLWKATGTGEVWALVNLGGGAVERIIAFTLTEDIGATTAGLASATFNGWVASGWGGYVSTTSDVEITVRDYNSIFSGGVSGTKGRARVLRSSSGIVYDIIQLGC